MLDREVFWPLWRYRGKNRYFGGKKVARTGVFLVKKVIFISKILSLHVFQRHTLKSCEKGGEYFVTSLNAGNGLFEQKVQKWR